MSFSAPSGTSPGGASGRTRLHRLGSHGPLYVQKPFYPDGNVCHVYLLHPPGGVVGGDTLEVVLGIEAGAHALFTTPAATKFMRSGGNPALQRQTITLEPGASAEWLPQESIVFNGALARNQTLVRLHPGATFVGWDISVFGRPANKEPFVEGRFDAWLQLDRWDAKTATFRPLFIDRQRYIGAGAELTRPWGLAGHPVSGTLAIAPADKDVLELLRRQLGEQDGENGAPLQATLVRDVLVLRCLGGSSAAVKASLQRAWEILRPVVLQRKPIPPAIWRT